MAQRSVLLPQLLGCCSHLCAQRVAAATAEDEDADGLSLPPRPKMLRIQGSGAKTIFCEIYGDELSVEENGTRCIVHAHKYNGRHKHNRHTNTPRYAHKHTHRHTRKHSSKRGAWWCIGRVDAFQPQGRGFESRSSCHVGTLGKFFIFSCL